MFEIISWVFAKVSNLTTSVTTLVTSQVDQNNESIPFYKTYAFYGIVGAIIVALLAWLINNRERFYYTPSTHIDNEIIDYAYSKYVNVFFDGDRLHGLYSQVSNKLVIYSHSFRGHLFNHIAILDRLKEQGISGLLWDYSGYGYSNGKPSEEQIKKDILNVIKDMSKVYTLDNIVLMGDGLGAYVSLWASVKLQMPKVIMLSPFTNMRDVVTEKLPSFLFWVSVWVTEYNTDELMRTYNNMNGKSLVIWSKQAPPSMPSHLSIKMAKLSTYNNEIEYYNGEPMINFDIIKKFIFSV